MKRDINSTTQKTYREHRAVVNNTHMSIPFNMQTFLKSHRVEITAKTNVRKKYKCEKV